MIYAIRRLRSKSPEQTVTLKTAGLRNSGKPSFVAIIEGHPISVKGGAA